MRFVETMAHISDLVENEKSEYNYDNAFFTNSSFLNISGFDKLLPKTAMNTVISMG